MGTTTKQKTTNKLCPIQLKSSKTATNQKEKWEHPKTTPTTKTPLKTTSNKKQTSKLPITKLKFFSKQPPKNGNTQKQPQQPNKMQKTTKTTNKHLFTQKQPKPLYKTQHKHPATYTNPTNPTTKPNTPACAKHTLNYLKRYALKQNPTPTNYHQHYHSLPLSQQASVNHSKHPRQTHESFL